MKPSTVCRLALALGASALLLAGCAAPSDAACPIQPGNESARLYGTWTVQIAGQPDGRLLLQKHPEYAGSVSGRYTRAAASNIAPTATSTTAQVVGDLDQGLFTLEESQDGKTTTGRWTGQWSSADCANEIRGDWIDARQEQAVLSPGDNRRAPTPHAFVMHRASGQPGWQ